MVESLNNTSGLITTVLQDLFSQLSSQEPSLDLEEEMQKNGLLVINSIDPKETLPGGYRSTAAIPYYPGATINTRGLETLELSGSSQFSEESLKSIIARTNLVAEHSFADKTPGFEKKTSPKLAILNLRQEDEVFLNGYCVSRVMPIPWWTGENPAGNRSIEEIERSEGTFKSLMGRSITVYNVKDGSAPKDHHSVLYEMSIPFVNKIETEKELAAKHGLIYHRIPDKKMGPVAWEDTDDFVKFANNLSKDTWLHIHCKRGQSRTTLFMAMYDIMKNAGLVPLQDIIERQGSKGLGGADFDHLNPFDWSYEYKSQWASFLKNFYSYCEEQKSLGYEKPWSLWAQEHAIPYPIPLQVQGKYYDKTTIESWLPTEEVSHREKPLVVNVLNEAKLDVMNLRSSRMLFNYDMPGKDFLAHDAVRLSGSTQPTVANLELLIPRIRKWSPNTPVVVVDLRHDDHIYLDGSDVNDFESVNMLSEKRTPEEIIESEENLTKWVLAQDGVEAKLVESRYPKDDYDTFATFRIKPKKVDTEKAIVEKLGANYLRIAGRRFDDVDDESVDQFLDYMKQMDPNTWYHFHCKKGKSRTTHFMTLYLIYKNALINKDSPLSIEELYDLAYLMGGVDLRNITPKDPSWKSEYMSKVQWIQFTVRFHRYCQEEAQNEFKKSWRQWSEENLDYMPDVEYLYRLNMKSQEKAPVGG